MSINKVCHRRYRMPENIILIIAMVAVGYLLLVVSYLLPTERMALSLHVSTDIFSRESYYYSPATANLDNYTDGFMLLIAAHDPEQLKYRAKLADDNVLEWSNECVWKKALRGTYIKCDTSGLTPPERIIDLYGENLPSEKIYSSADYARYWHGYLIFLKPLLMYGTYSQIRNVLAFIQLGLFTILIFLLAKCGNSRFIPGIFAFWIFCNPTATMSSLQYTAIFLITILACIGLCIFAEKCKKDKNNDVCIEVKRVDSVTLFFCFVGGLTSYFDFFTYPIVTLGVPLLLWVCIGNNIIVTDWIWNSVSWMMGYSGMWAGKWILASLILDENIVRDAIEQILFRTGIKSTGANGAVLDIENMDNNSISLLEVLKAQKGFCMQYANKLMLYLFILCVAILTIYYLLNKASLKKRFKKQDIVVRLIPLLAISCYPFAWYACVKNHSIIHAWMTYRDLSITIVAGWFLLAMFLKKVLQDKSSSNP